MKYVELPDLGVSVEFPDDMSDYDIEYVIRRDLYDEPVSKAGVYFNRFMTDTALKLLGKPKPEDLPPEEIDPITGDPIRKIAPNQPPLPKDWTMEEELEFSDWYKNWSEETGIAPDPDDPRNFYDYRAAFRANAGPEMGEDGVWHWSEAYKQSGDPKLVLGSIDTKAGTPEEDPAETPTPKRLAIQAYRTIGQGAAKASKGIEEMMLHKDERLLTDPEYYREKFGYPPTPFDLKMLKMQHEWRSENEEYVRDVFKEFKDAYPELLPGKPSTLEQILTAPLLFAPAMALSIASGGAGFALTFLTIFGYSMDDYEEEIKRIYGVDPDEDPKIKQRLFDTAFLNATYQTPIEFAGNMIQLHGIFNMVKASRLGKHFPERLAIFTETILKNAIAEGLEEYLQEYGEEISKYYAANPHLPPEEITAYIMSNLKEIAKETHDQGLHAAAIGAAAGAWMAGVPGLAMLGDQKLDSYRIEKRKKEFVKKVKTELDKAIAEGEFLPPPMTESARAEREAARPEEDVPGPLFEEAAPTFRTLDDAARAGIEATEEQAEQWRETHRELLDEAEFFKETKKHKEAMAALREAQLYTRAIEAFEEPERYEKMAPPKEVTPKEVTPEERKIGRKEMTVIANTLQELGLIDTVDMKEFAGLTNAEARGRLRSVIQEQLESMRGTEAEPSLAAALHKLTEPRVERQVPTGKIAVAPSYPEAVKAATSPTDNIIVQPKRDKPGRVLLTQIGTAATVTEGKEDMAAGYFDKLYSEREGYTRPDDFWEVPTWIPTIAGSVTDSDMMVVRDADSAARQITEGGYEAVMFSAMDVNKHVIKQIAEQVGPGVRIVVGGYVDPKYFKDTPNVEFMPDVKSAVESLGETYKEGVTSMQHFKGTQTIPRLCMSRGCLHKCSFCTVPKDVKAESQESIDTQLEDMKGLDFGLIYLDDKTFGQAKNYERLPDIYKKVKEFNPKFQGFVIQTTATQLLKLDTAFLKESGIAFVELGVESYNDSILAKIHKPARTKTIDAAVEKLREAEIAFIPNILVGLTGKGWSETKETYQNTLDFLNSHSDIISHVNVYNLALYEGTELAEQIEQREDIDIDENRVERSYHKDKKLHEAFYKAVLDFGKRQLDKKPFEARPVSEPSIAIPPEVKKQLGLFKEKKKAERKMVGKWVQPKDEVIIDEETGEARKAMFVTPEAEKALAKAGVKTGRGRFQSGSNFLVSVTDDARGGVVYGLAKPSDTKTSRVKDFLHGKETLTEYWRDIGGKLFKVLNRPILPKKKADRVKEIDKLIQEFKHELEWYNRWNAFMQKFQGEKYSAADVNKMIKTQAILSAGASPAGAQTAFGKVLRDIENYGEARGGEGHGYPAIIAQKVNRIWKGEDADIVTLQNHQDFYGPKIGAMVYAGLYPDVREGAVVVDRHMPRLWGYNVMWGGSFRVPVHVQREITEDIVEAAQRNDTSVPAVQAALWYATGAGHWGSPTHFEETVRLQPKKSLGVSMLDLITVEPQAITSFRGKLYYTIRGAQRPTPLTPQENSRLQKLTAKSKMRGLFTDPMTATEKHELLALQHKREGDTPSPWSKNDVVKRMEAHTPDNPYVPLGYWYGPGVRREAFFFGKEPHLTIVYENEIYDAIADKLGYKQIAMERALNDSEVRAGKRNVSDIYMNTLAGIIHRTGDFKGFAMEQNGETWMLTFGDVVIEEHPTTVTVGLSDQVSGVVKLPESLQDLADASGVPAQNLYDHISGLAVNYPITLNAVHPTLARFGDATSGKVEYGLAVKMTGPISAIRAALSSEVGLKKHQDGIIVFHGDGPPNGRILKFTLKERDLKNIQKALLKFQIDDFNLKFVGGNWVFDTFVAEGGADSRALVDAYLNFFERHGKEGSLEHIPARAELITREKVDEDVSDYKTHMLRYFGKKKGEDLYAKSSQEGTEWAATAQLVFDTAAARSGGQRSQAAEERSVRKRFRKSETEKPRAEPSISVWHGTRVQGLTRMDVQYIGTGEGSQVFGWGFYFSDAKSVADTYGVLVTFDGLDPREKRWQIVSAAKKPGAPSRWGDHPIAWERRIADRLGMYNTVAQARQSLALGGFDHEVAYMDKLFKEGRIKEELNTYRATLHKGKKPGEYEYLDWNEKAGSATVNIIIAQARKEGLEKLVKDYSAALGHVSSYEGRKLYADLSMKLGSDREASLFLMRAGIDGIKYPAGTLSGITDSKATNYVVFDPDVATIEHYPSLREVSHLGPARAVFLGWQERLDKPPIALYNIMGEHSHYGSTVTEESLKKFGIPIPPPESSPVLGGQNAKGFPSGPLAMALRMEAAGATESRIWEETGWIRNPADQLWRFEIADHGARLLVRKAKSAGKLRQVLEHPNLFKYYPTLRDITVEIAVDPKMKQTDRGGSYREETRHITVAARTHSEALGTLLHEIQHAIQHIEGFARGGSVQDWTPEYAQFARDHLKDYVAELRDLGLRPEDPSLAIQYDGLKEELEFKIKELQAAAAAVDANDYYRRLAGELESNDVVRRWASGPEYAQLVKPYSSIWLARDKWLAIDGTGTSFSVVPPQPTMTGLNDGFSPRSLLNIPKIGALADTLREALKISGLGNYADVLARTELLMKPFIPMDVANLSPRSIREWAAALGRTEQEVFNDLQTGKYVIEGLTTVFDPTHAAIELALEMHSSFQGLQGTFYHEAWHLVEKWVLPTDVYAKMEQWVPNKEERADMFKEYVRNRHIEMAQPSKVPSWVRDWWNRIINFLHDLRRGLRGLEVSSPNEVFDLVRRGKFSPHFGVESFVKNHSMERITQDTLNALEDMEFGDTDIVSLADKTDFVPDEPLVAKRRVRDVVDSWMSMKEKPTWTPETGKAPFQPDFSEPRLLELPELVELVKLLSGGKLPSVRQKILGRDNIRGVFFPGKGTIQLKAEIFQDTDGASRTLAHEIGHLVDWLPDHLIHGNILGKIAGLKRELPKVLPFEPGAPGELTAGDLARLRAEAIRLLGVTRKERTRIIEQIIEEMPITSQDVLNIWNSVEQAQLINPELYKFVSGLDSNAKKLIVKEALKGIVAEELKQFAKLVTEKTEAKEVFFEAPSEKAVQEKLAALINEEIKKRKLFVEEEVRDELKTLSARWRPFDPAQTAAYTKYRWTSAELYADALSVLLNDPHFLRAQAPRFYEAFFNYVEEVKPEFREVYLDIQRQIHSGLVDKRRTENFYRMFDEGNKAYASQLQSREYTRDHLLRDFNDTFHFINKDVKKIGYNQISPQDNPTYRLEEMTYTGSEIEAFLTDLYFNVVRPLKTANLQWDREFGLLITLRRIAIERDKMANPAGLDAQTAINKINAMRTTELTPDQWAVLQDSVKKFRKLHEEYFIDKAEAAQVFDDSLIKLFRDNEAYARFEVLPYLEKRYGRPVAMRVHKQIGTFQDIANPATATLMNDIAFIKAVNKNTATRTVVKFYQDYGKILGIEIKEADKRWNGRFREIQEPKIESGQGLVTYLYKGKAYGYYLPKEVADAINKNHAQALGVAKIFRAMTSPFRKVFTEYNYGFWLFNVARDSHRMTVALPGFRYDKFVTSWFRGLKPALRSVLGIPDPVIKEMQKNNMLISIADFQGHTTEDFQVDKLLRVYDMMGPQKFESRIKGPFGHLFNWVLNSSRLYKAAHYYAALGKSLERATKVGSYIYLKEKFPDMPNDVIGHIVRVRGGSPDFLRAGREVQLYNNIIMFSNAMKEGYTGDFEAFKERPGEFFVKRLVALLVPKLLMYAGLYGLLGDPIKEILEGVSEYDLTNYIIIPLGLTPTGKSVYFRVPVDETGRWLGGMFWKMLRTPELGVADSLPAILDYTAGQIPSVTPLVGLIPDVLDYVTGRNPYDNFYGRHAIPPLEFQAYDRRSHAYFLKYLAENMGSNIAYKFKHDKVEPLAKELETLLGFPISSPIADFMLKLPDEPVGHNTLGRFLKVSDYGKREKLLRIKADIRRENAKKLLDSREAAYAIVDDRELSDAQLLALAMKPDVVNRQMMLALGRKYGMVYFEEWLSAGTTEEKFAMLSAMIEKNALTAQDMIHYIPESGRPVVEQKLPGLSVKERLEQK